MCKTVFVKLVMHIAETLSTDNQSINQYLLIGVPRCIYSKITQNIIYNLPVMQRLNRDRANGNKQIINAASIFVNWILVNWIRMYKPG